MFAVHPSIKYVASDDTLTIDPGNVPCIEPDIGPGRCLSKYEYQQNKCVKEVEQLLRCCQSLHNPGASVHCKGFIKEAS